MFWLPIFLSIRWKTYEKVCHFRVSLTNFTTLLQILPFIKSIYLNYWPLKYEHCCTVMNQKKRICTLNVSCGRNDTNNSLTITSGSDISQFTIQLNFWRLSLEYYCGFWDIWKRNQNRFKWLGVVVYEKERVLNPIKIFQFLLLSYTWRTSDLIDLCQVSNSLQKFITKVNVLLFIGFDLANEIRAVNLKCYFSNLTF